MTERRVVSTYDPGIFDVNNIDEAKQIILTPEGQIVKKRYRVVRINSDSVVLEDVELKREQTLKIAEDAGGTA